MRGLVACVLVAGCHATVHAPPIAATRRAVAPPPSPPPASTLSFLERVTPQGVDVPHALVVVLRRFGPETIDAQLADLSEHMRGCYTSSLTFLMTPRHDYMTMTIDAQAGDTSVELEPQNISPLATCLVHSLVDSRFDAGSHHVVLTIDATLWFEATTSQPL